jgi:energy-coupling factor transport system permease protein
MSLLDLFKYKKKESVIHNLDPRIRFLWFFAVTLPAVAWTDPIWLTLLFLGVLATGLLSKQSLKSILTPLVYLSPALAFLLIFNLFFYGPSGISPTVGTQQYFIGYIIPKIGNFGPYGRLSVESLVYAIGAMERLMIIALAGRLLLTFISPSEITQVMSKLKVPVEITTAISVAFGFLPVAANQVVSIFESQKARGWKVNTKNPIKALKLYIPTIVPTIVRAFTRAEYLAAAISSRGFGYIPGKRTSMYEMKMRKNDYIALVVLLVFLVFSELVGSFVFNIANYNFTSCMIRNLLHSPC